MMTRLLKILAVVLLPLLLAQCGDQAWHNSNADALPDAPDYADGSQWYVTQRGAQADVFYIISTETGDYSLNDGTICHYADTHNDSLRAPLTAEMLGVDTLISGNLNFYAPYYRQCCIQSFMSDSTMARRMPVPTADVKRAFAYYLKQFNRGRPFVLAGFSQGATIMLELLREMDEATFSRMIAAYAIGVPISQATLDNNPHIVPARSATDTGVTIGYNSVKSPQCIMRGWENGVMVINPVNWLTDATPATLVTAPSPLLPVADQQPLSLQVHIDTASHLLIVDGYTATDYMLPFIGVEGCYHSREIWLYRDQLRENIALRSAQMTNL